MRNWWAWLPWMKEPDHRPSENDHRSEAKQARQRAEKDLKKIRAQRPEIERVANHLREIRRTNHLAEIFEESIRRKGGEPHGGS